MTLTAHGRLALTGAALGAAALLAAGCSSSSSSSSTAPSSTSSGAAGGSASGSASGSGSGSGSASAPAGGATTGAPGSGTATSPSSGSSANASGAPACATSHLTVKTGGSEGAAGSVYTTLVFTNTGSSTCTLYGYPGVSLLDSGGQIGAAATRSPTHAPSVVALKPGGVANVTLQVAQALNYPSSKCTTRQATMLRVYPPGQTQSIDVPFKATGCAQSSVKLLSVTAVASGASSNG